MTVARGDAVQLELSLVDKEISKTAKTFVERINISFKNKELYRNLVSMEEKKSKTNLRNSKTLFEMSERETLV